MKREINIGLFGFGCVGQGLYDVLNGSKGFKAQIHKIAIKDANKQRTLPANLFTTNHDELLDNPAINTIVELIDDADAAYRIVKKALINGKNVVTANKKMLATHLVELKALQEKHNVSLLYEASVCGSIPIIRNLEEYYDNDLLSAVSGIFNGSSNYILSKIFQEGWDYPTALKAAQELGFAESDPTLDVGGFDPKFKLIILTYHSFGIYIKPEDVLNVGINQLTAHDFNYAKEKGLKIKLVPSVQRINDKEIALFVLPQFVKADNPLYYVEQEYNGVIVDAAFACSQTFTGKGAGGHPTGSAVLSDISALQYDYRYEYKKQAQGDRPRHSNDINLEVYIRYTDEALIKKLNFSEITEWYNSKDYQYVRGVVNLQQLIDFSYDIERSNSFVATTGIVEVSSANPVQKTLEYSN